MEPSHVCGSIHVGSTRLSIGPRLGHGSVALGDMKYQLGYRREAEIAKAVGVGYPELKVPEKDGDKLQSHR